MRIRYEVIRVDETESEKPIQRYIFDKLVDAEKSVAVGADTAPDGIHFYIMTRYDKG